MWVENLHTFYNTSEWKFIMSGMCVCHTQYVRVPYKTFWGRRLLCASKCNNAINEFATATHYLIKRLKWLWRIVSEEGGHFLTLPCKRIGDMGKILILPLNFFNQFKIHFSSPKYWANTLVRKRMSVVDCWFVPV